MKKKKNKRRKIRINRLITLLLFVFMICFGIIVFIKSDFFSLKYVKIVNNNILTKSDISQLSKITVGKNIFTYDLKKIKSNIEENSYVENISMNISGTVQNWTGWMAKIGAGTYSFDPKDYIPHNERANYKITENENGTWTVEKTA